MKPKQYRLGETTWTSVPEYPADELFFCKELSLHFQKEWLLKMGAVPVGGDKPQLPEKLGFERLSLAKIGQTLNDLIDYLEKREQ